MNLIIRVAVLRVLVIAGFILSMMGNPAGGRGNTAAQANVTDARESEIAALHDRARRAELLVTQQGLLVSMLSELLANHTLQGALDALAGALKMRFNCDRVAIALLGTEVSQKNTLRLAAVSQQAVLEASSSEACLLVDAMREACDHEEIVCWPSNSASLGVLIAHRSLAGRRLSATFCSVPLYENQELVGAILLERRNQQAFPISMLEQLSVCLAPLLALHQRADRGWWVVFRNNMNSRFQRYLGQERPGMRVLYAPVALVLAGLLTVPIKWQVVAQAELLSYERRLITAPSTGFVADMQVAAGDQVVEGQLLAQLDRREMELEAASRDSDVVMAEAEFRAAMASYDRQTTGIARARLAQARARRETVEQRLERTSLVSPIDGLVIAADATRTSGTAVSRGDTLFEIAPSTDFEVHVLVDEADIYDVRKGQTGMLSLKAMPGEGLPIVVESVYPVAEAKAGENRFRVRANLVSKADGLRPGQSGVVRLDAGRMSAMKVLTRRLNRRLSELWWRWVG